jgi:L-ascorbate metabolism protein UlaG (beta-lactamase superfamily)
LSFASASRRWEHGLLFRNDKTLIGTSKLPGQTQIHYLSHATVLIPYGNHFLLTDPWYQRPAFGSWLPIPPITVHPSYLVALASGSHSFGLLISHGHDDHLDDDWLTEFPHDTPTYISRFARPL